MRVDGDGGRSGGGGGCRRRRRREELRHAAAAIRFNDAGGSRDEINLFVTASIFVRSRNNMAAGPSSLREG